MKILNFEFKTRTANLETQELKLLSKGPLFIGEDHQTDTYFKVEQGRLKLREGNIENSLIYYERENLAGTKKSDILLYQHLSNPSLKEILQKTHSVLAVVKKIRRIYFIENVKFHFDVVEGLGTFIEVEAIDKTGEIGIEKLQQQCRIFADLFEVKEEDYISYSYSDLLLQQRG